MIKIPVAQKHITQNQMRLDSLHIISKENLFKYLLILAFLILSFLSVAVSGYGRTKEIPADPTSTELIEDVDLAEIM
jgi:hypothetical protein